MVAEQSTGLNKVMVFEDEVAPLPDSLASFQEQRLPEDVQTLTQQLTQLEKVLARKVGGKPRNKVKAKIAKASRKKNRKKK